MGLGAGQARWPHPPPALVHRGQAAGQRSAPGSGLPRWGWGSGQMWDEKCLLHPRTRAETSETLPGQLWQTPKCCLPHLCPD